MKVEKIGDQLAIVIPQDVAETLGLHEGDSVEVRRRSDPAPMTRTEAIAAIRALARPLPPGYKFDREEANAR
ncbi:AbrB/MazE/SpoVT family DNA-binding domain-containing protein [Sphingomonas panni]